MGFWISLFKVSISALRLGRRGAAFMAVASLPASLPVFAASRTYFALSYAVDYIIVKLVSQIFNRPPSRRNSNEETVERQLSRVAAILEQVALHLESQSAVRHTSYSILLLSSVF